MQSIVPSSLVTDYLASLSTVNTLEKVRILNDKTYQQLKLSLESESAQTELERYFTSGISKSISEKSLAETKAAANKFTNARFMNVVEEPEQNLFPDSQMKNIYFLMSAVNRNLNNSIVITTHSPYILSDITLATKAYFLLEKGVPKERIEKIVPVNSTVDGEKLVVYENKKDWNAVVESENRGDFNFIAVDNKIPYYDEHSNEKKRCDAMVWTTKTVVFIELKDQSKDWFDDAVAQLKSTIEHFDDVDGLDQFEYRRAYACNKTHPYFNFHYKERMQ